MICPLPAPAEWISRKAFTAVRFIKKPIKGKHHKYTGLGLDWPKKLRNMWLQNIIFLSRLSAKFAGYKGNVKQLVLQLSYMLIPVGIFAWIAFSLPSIMVNYSYVLNVLSDPLGYGWNIFGTANVSFNPFYPEIVPLIQGLLLLTGLYFGINRVYLSLTGLIADPSKRKKAILLPGFFALAVVNIFLKLYLG